MRVREETPDAIFKGFCAIALSLWVSEKKMLLSYLLFGMGAGWIVFMVCELLGWVTIDRRPTECKCKEVSIRSALQALILQQVPETVSSNAEKGIKL